MDQLPTLSERAPAGELVLGRYRLVRRIGAGGMGVVWLAHDEHLDRPVAVKRIPTEGTGAGARAQREAVAAARLAHPAIVALYEAGRDEEGWVLVTEIVRGRTFGRLQRDGALSDRDVLVVGVTLCDALEHAHARGVVHRDVKPSNVLCPETPEGGAPAKLTDFGIAHLAGTGDDPLTRTGDVMGTLAYMAPEQAAGRAVGAAADVYSLGLVLFEALAGVNPIRGANAAETARRVGMRPAPLRRVRRDLPAELCRAVDAAVRPEPGERPPLRDLRAALLAAEPLVGDEPGTVDPPALEGVTRAWRARREHGLWPLRPARDEPGGEVAPEQRSGDAAAAGDERSGPRERPRARALAVRLAAALATGGLVAAAVRGFGPGPAASGTLGVATIDPLLAGGLAAALAAALPRFGPCAAAALLVGWLGAHAPGLALLVAVAVLAVPPLLAFTPAAWPLPAGAPLLGIAGLAGAWPALAGQAARWHVRAALGALGAWWTCLAEPALGRSLLFGTPPGVGPRAGWDASVGRALDGALAPLTGGALALAALWALAAAVLPLLVRGRAAAVDLVAATGWAAALAAGTQAVAEASGLPDPRGLVLGAAGAAALAVAARAVRRPV